MALNIYYRSLFLGFMGCSLLSCGTEFGNGNKRDDDPTGIDDKAEANDAADNPPESDPAEDTFIPATNVDILTNLCYSPAVAGALGTYRSGDVSIEFDYDAETLVYSVGVAGEDPRELKANTETANNEVDAVAENFTALEFTCGEVTTDDDGFANITLSLSGRDYILGWKTDESENITVIRIGEELYESED